MTYVRVKGFQIFEDRHGKQRCYHRKTKEKIDLEKYPLGSAGFLAECSRINAAYEALKSREPKVGTLGGLLKTYFATDHFRDLSPRTKQDYRKAAGFIEPLNELPVHKIDTPSIARILDKAKVEKGCRQSNMLRTVLGQAFKQAVPLGLIDKDYASDTIQKRRPKDAPRANRPWRREECEVVLSEAPPHIGATVSLMMNTGLDPSDALKLRRNQIEGNTIWGVRGKTRQKVAIPVGRRLAAALEDAPRHDAITILANSRGRPWTYNGFSTVWHKFKKRLEERGLIEPGLTLKGLRHTVATELREAGATERQIADLLGQKTEAMARHYSKDANLAELNRETARLREPENEDGTDFVKPLSESVKLNGSEK